MRTEIKEKDLVKGQLLYETELSNVLLRFEYSDNTGIYFTQISGSKNYIINGKGLVGFINNPEENYYLPAE